MSAAASGHGELKTKTALSMMWSLVRVGWTTASTFVVFLLLARILGPREFGTFALAGLFAEVGRIIANAGMGDVVTRQLHLDEELADTAFWSTLGLTGVISLATFFAAPAYAALVRDPAVSEILRWLALLMPLAALGAIHSARLARDFGHRTMAWQAIVTGTVSGVSAVLAALAGWGVHALVVQVSVASVLTVVFAWSAYRWVPRMRFSVAQFRSIFVFSVSTIVTQLLWTLLARVQDIFISRWYGPVEVGRYRIAWRLIELIGQIALAPISNVALVTLSRLQGEPGRFESAYNRIVNAAALGTFPLLLGFGALADEIIPLLFGAQWGSTGPLASALVFMAVPFVLNYFAPTALSAKNHAQSVLAVAALQLSLTLALTWSLVPYGTLAVAVAYVARAWLTMPYQQYVLRRRAGIAARGTIRAVALPLGASVVMAACVYLAKPAIASWLDSQVLRLAAGVALGAAIYGGILAALGRRMLRPYAEVGMSFLRRRSASPAL